MPILAKYEFSARGRLHLFAGAGVSTMLSHQRQSEGLFALQTPVTVRPTLTASDTSRLPTQRFVSVGPTIAAGSITSIRRLRVSTEVRYTRFMSEPVTLPAVRSNRNHVKLLIGVLF